VSKHHDQSISFAYTENLKELDLLWHSKASLYAKKSLNGVHQLWWPPKGYRSDQTICRPFKAEPLCLWREMSITYTCKSRYMAAEEAKLFTVLDSRKGYTYHHCLLHEKSWLLTTSFLRIWLFQVSSSTIWAIINCRSIWGTTQHKSPNIAEHLKSCSIQFYMVCITLQTEIYRSILTCSY